MAEQNENIEGEGAAEQPAADIPSAEQLAEGETANAAEAAELDAELADLVSATIGKEAELLADLQRLQAEYVNYKARVDRDREVSRNNAIAEVLRAFLPALDDLTRAEEHGDLDGSPFAAVASKLRTAGEKFGLKSFGAVGDKFDPEFHEALVQTPSPEATENTVADVVEPGYQLGDRVIRVAKVAVFIPAEG